MDINSLFNEIGENCPFLLSTHLGVTVEYPNLGKATTGVYMYSSDLEKHFFFINTILDFDERKTVCLLLLKHHIEHKGKGADISFSFEDISDITLFHNETKRQLRKITKFLTKIPALLTNTSNQQ